MKKDKDCIQFENRNEIGIVARALTYYLVHNPKEDTATSTLEQMQMLLDVMDMEW